MKEINNTFQISDIIYKSAIESLSSEEEKILKNWLQSGDNLALYRKILNRESVQNTESIYKLSSKEEALKKLQKRIQQNEIQKQQKPVNQFKFLYKYAAILIGCLLIGSAAYFISTSSMSTTHEVVKTIAPGFEKATLVLANGTKVNLEKGLDSVIQTSGVVAIENKDNVLKYRAVNSAVLPTVSYNTLYVPVGGIYEIELPDGTKAWVNSASSLKFPETFSGSLREVILEGEAYFEVAKNEKMPFVVKNNTADITVLGTSFNVSSYTNDDFFSTTLVEGKIKLTNTDDKSIVVKPGQRAVVLKDQKEKVILKEVDTRIYTTWKDGKFYFEKERLEDLFVKVGRWYNFEPMFSSNELKEQLFTGTVSKENDLELLLKMISKSSKIKYEIRKSKTDEKYLVEISKK
ncbi:FecR family protein [Joostella sp. CR20]|uniref:FecR family protein n=1 Tax=Joostella sp. CR20 TaxID=2804312 RepID=UPI00313A8726